MSQTDLHVGMRVTVNGRLRGTITSIYTGGPVIYYVTLDEKFRPLDEEAVEEAFGRSALAPWSLLDELAEAADESPPA